MSGMYKGTTGTTGDATLMNAIAGPIGIEGMVDASNIFNKSNMMMVFWFLAIYVIVNLFIGVIFKQGTSHYIDAIIFGILFILGVSTVYSMSEPDQETMLSQIFNYFVNYLNQPTSIISVGIFIVVFYTIIYIFKLQMTDDSESIFITLIEYFAWFMFLILLTVEFFKVFFQISLIDLLLGNVANLINDAWTRIPNSPTGGTGTKKIETKIETKIGTKIGTTNVPQNEVFNVDNNLYTYDDAQAICSSYDARLATYDDIEKSYNDGGEWCNYGWSANQMALFPTQKATWNKLQQTTDHKNDCGRPGVNGGHIDNPYVKFGVNCFGIKPQPTQADTDRMFANSEHVYPKTKEDAELDTKIAYWKANSAALLQLNAFSHNQWNDY